MDNSIQTALISFFISAISGALTTYIIIKRKK